MCYQKDSWAKNMLTFFLQSRLLFQKGGTCKVYPDQEYGIKLWVVYSVKYKP